MQRKIILQYYILSAMFSAAGTSLISAIYVTFLMRNGLSLLEVNLVNTVFFLTLFICEIPTGAFADIFGRKTSFVAACGLMSVSMFVYGSSGSFLGFAVAEAIGAVAATFQSGAFQAWLVDSLKHHGYEGELNPIFGREGFIRQVGGGIGAVIGSYAAAVNPVIPWYMGGVFMGITAIAACRTMKEDYFIRIPFSLKNGLQSMKETVMTSIRYGVTDKAVRFVLIFTGLQIFAVQSLNMYWQPFFKNHSVSEKHLGWLFIGMVSMLSVGTYISSRIKTSGEEKKTLIKMQMLTGILVIMAIFAPISPLVITIFLLHEIPRGCLKPLLDSYLQTRIPSKERATISSFCSTAPHIGGAIGLVTSGVIAQFFGISSAWIVSGLILVIGSALLARNGKCSR